jgi:GNAT superfamily N-acetyltransferase
VPPSGGPLAGSVPAFRIEPYARARHGKGPALVVEDVYREFGFTWEPHGYHHDVLHPEEAYPPPAAFFDVAVDVMTGDVVGTVGGESSDGVAELQRLYLFRAWRGKGVGRALLERFLSWARARGCTRAILWSDKRFTDAHRLYSRVGFRVMADRVCDDPDLSPEWGYTLDLVPGGGASPGG